LRNQQSIPPLAIEKAEAAYQVMIPLKAALTKFKSDTDLRFHCYDNLAIYMESGIYSRKLVVNRTEEKS
jgi:hypothetical protein